MRLVVLESPMAGDVERNRRYLLRCIRDCLARGESPIASHQTFAAALDDADPAQRDLGIRAGFAWRGVADATVVYADHGISSGMQLGVEDATRERDARVYRTPFVRHAIEFRKIGAEPGEETSG